MNPISALLQAEHRLVARGAAGAAAVAARIERSENRTREMLFRPRPDDATNVHAMLGFLCSCSLSGCAMFLLLLQYQLRRVRRRRATDARAAPAAPRAGSGLPLRLVGRALLLNGARAAAQAPSGARLVRLRP